MDFFEFFKQLYLTELERKNHLTGALTIPVGIVLVVAGGLSFVLQGIRLDDHSGPLIWLSAAIL
ncbi:MAG: hypothetical protein V3T83_04725, partial [Acidobacteriota bacterium]